MRKQIVQTITDIFESNDKAVLVLGDIGVYAFGELADKYPKRVINIGICEQATIGVCAGLAKSGFLPIFYTIAPFAVERCLEQLKIDVGYQNLPIAIVSVGASYDYSSLGCTHHCPADVALLKTIPNFTILAPGSNYEVDTLFKQSFGKSPVYMRLSEHGHNNKNITFKLGTSNLLSVGKRGTIVVIGEMLDKVIEAKKGLDVSVYYYTTLTPFEEFVGTGKVAIVEPFYEGTMVHDVVSSCTIGVTVLSIGVPRKFLTNYGTKEEQDIACGLDVESLKIRLNNFFNGQ